jgi:hypothetical protein
MLVLMCTLGITSVHAENTAGFHQSVPDGAGDEGASVVITSATNDGSTPPSKLTPEMIEDLKKNTPSDQKNKAIKVTVMNLDETNTYLISRNFSSIQRIMPPKMKDPIYTPIVYPDTFIGIGAISSGISDGSTQEIGITGLGIGITRDLMPLPVQVPAYPY